MSRFTPRAALYLFWLLALAIAWPVLAQQAPTDEANEPSAETSDERKFLRLTRDEDDKPLAMETAIVRFEAPPGHPHEGLIVDLIGVVHIGEKEYYEELNQRFDEYDVVLYELVAPEGTRVPEGGGDRSGHPVSMLQMGMKNMLGLESQLEHIDYQKENLQHADMSPEQFAESMRDKGETMLTMFIRMMGQSIAQQNINAQRNPSRRNSDLGMLLAMFRRDRDVVLKQMMAEQFEDLEGMMAGLEGPDGSTLISERNKVALEVMQQQIDDGKRRIAIFYGAGHMPDFAQRLTDEFNLERTDEDWLAAWNLAEGQDR